MRPILLADPLDVIHEVARIEAARVCPACGGTGTVKDSNGVRWRCAACRGTGERQLSEHKSLAEAVKR